MDIRNIAESDIPELVGVMSETRGSVAQATDPAILRALCRDACRNRKPPCLVIVVAEEERGIAGYAVAEIGGATYWKAFARRHPLAAAQILWKRVIKRFKRSSRPAPVQPPREASAWPPKETSPVTEPARMWDRTWQDQGLHIARVQQIAVRPSHRGRGVGARLYEQLFAAVLPL